MGHPSSIGYGYNPYGHPYGGTPFNLPNTAGPFPMLAGYGYGDWAEEVTWRLIPEFYKALDGTQGEVAEPLRGFIDSVKPLLNELLNTWRIFPTQWDALLAPIDRLAPLATTVGIELDSEKNERLQRTEVLNQAFLILNKGTDQGYVILAAFEDLLVEITPLWADECGPGANLSADAPSTFYPQFDEVAADDLPLDGVYTDPYALWPLALHGGETCRTHKLRLLFTPTDNPSQDFDPDVASRIADRLLRFKPAHVEIDRITFDGLRGSSQTWIDRDVVAENSAVGMWIDSVVGSQVGSSAPWIDSVVGTTL